MLSGCLARSDRKPLGSVERVQRELTSAFPRTHFIKVDAPSEALKYVRGNWVVRLLSILSPKLRYPHWSGHFEGDGFIAVFEFDSQAMVQSIRVELYGRTLAATPLFNALADRTGWLMKHLG
jgi:hypothetical protein